MTALILKWSDFFHSYQTTYLDRYQSSVYTYEVTGWFSMYYRGSSPYKSFITMNFIMRFWLLQIFPTTKSRIRQGPSLTLFLPGEGRISPYMSVTWPSQLGIGLNQWLSIDVGILCELKNGASIKENFEKSYMNGSLWTFF